MYALQEAHPFGETGRLAIPSEPTWQRTSRRVKDKSKAAAGRDRSHAQAR
jgi:hypothetical protein